MPRKPPAKPDDRFVVASLRAVANFFGVSETTVRKEWQARDMPGRPGCYRLDEVARWKTKREQERANAPGIPGDVDSAKQRKQEADARKAEIEVRRSEREDLQEEGQLVSLDWVCGILSRALTTFRQRCQALPAERAQLFPQEVRAQGVHEWQQAQRLLLNELTEVGLKALDRDRRRTGDGEH